METYYDVLKSLGACEAALEARKNMTVEEAMANPKRGDWILWLAKKLDLPVRIITLAKARSAATIKHLMGDERSIKALEVAERFGLGEVSEPELKIAADAAYAAAYAAYAAYTDAAAYAAYTDADADAAYAAYAAACAAYAAYTAAYAADATAYAADAAYAAATAIRENLKLTATICVEILGKDIIAEVNRRIGKGDLQLTNPDGSSITGSSDGDGVERSGRVAAISLQG